MHKRQAESTRIARHISRARLMGLEATLSLDEWLATLDLFNWSCAYCGGAFEGIEHLIPDYYGGGTTRENCLPACRSCNQQKANIDPRIGYMAAPKPFDRKLGLKIQEGTKAFDRGLAPHKSAEQLIMHLRDRQRDRTQREFALELGISESMLSRLYFGSRRPGIDVLTRIYTAFPSLQSEVMNCLLQD